jgi:hypothetical protein
MLFSEKCPEYESNYLAVLTVEVKNARSLSPPFPVTTGLSSEKEPLTVTFTFN